MAFFLMRLRLDQRILSRFLKQALGNCSLKGVAVCLLLFVKEDLAQFLTRHQVISD
jgi:hypothetical protein